MNQETLVNELKTRVGDTDLSDRTFSEVAENALPMFADDSKITDDTWKLPVGMLKSLSGQYRADQKAWINGEREKLAAADKASREEFEKNFKAQWEKDHPTAAQSQSKPADDKKVADDKGADDGNAMVKAIMEAIAANNAKLFGDDGKGGTIGAQLASVNKFIEQSNAKAKEARIEGVRKELKDYLVGKKANREPVINLAIKDLKIDDNSDIDKLKIEVEKSYEAKYKEFYGDGGKPFGGSSAGGGDTESPDEEVKDYLKKQNEKYEKRMQRAEDLRKSFV